MPVYEQGYQHWDGRLAGHGWRWWAIARQGVVAQLRNRRAKYLIISAWVPALGLAAILGFWGLLEQKSETIEPFLVLFQWLPEEMREGPRAFRGSVWTIAFHWFLFLELGASMLLVLMVGPDLISQDLRSNAMPLYLSRPLRRVDYFAGKLGVIGFFLGAVTIVPAVLAYAVGVAFSMDASVVRDTWRVLAGSVAYGALVALVSGLLMLALSSLSRNSRVVAMMWVGVWIMSDMVAGALRESETARGLPADEAARRWQVVSFGSNLNRVREALLDTPAAHDQVAAAQRRAREDMLRKVRMARRVIGSGGIFSRLRGGGGLGNEEMELPPGLGGLEDEGQDRGEDGFGPRSRFDLLGGLVSPYPWTASAWVLLGVCAASCGILATRVQSLDRLR